MLPNTLKKKVVDPVLDLLRQGITPQKLALSLALGSVIGTFPLIGSTTVICTVCAFAFRLNLPAIQIANYAVFSLQVILLLPLMQLGTFVFGAQSLPFSADEITAMFDQGWWDAVTVLWRALVYAMGVWVLFAVPVGWILYGLLKSILIRIAPRVAPVQ